MPTKTRAGLRPKTIKRADLASAIKLGREVSDAWLRHSGNDAWHAEYLEIMLMPGMWKRMLAKMREEGCAAWVYTNPPRRYVATQYSYAGVPGYVFDGWNGEPRENWHASHSPGNCWNGVSRNCFASLAEWLRGWHYAETEQTRDHYAGELWNRWRIRVS